jgi:hypothetical protein
MVGAVVVAAGIVVGFAGEASALLSANGEQLNGVSLNGASLNGKSLNGTSPNGSTMQGRQTGATGAVTATEIVLPGGDVIELSAPAK